MATLVKLVLFASVAVSMSTQAIRADVAAHARAAQQAEARNDFATAVREYEYVVRALPRNAEMQSNLGVAFYFAHDLTRAINVLQTAVGLNEKLATPHLFLGLAWFRLSNPDAAASELKTAVHLNPSDVIGHTWLGYAYVAQSDYEPALKELQVARNLDPNNLDVLFALGQTYLEIGKKATQGLLTLTPDGGRAWQLSGEQCQLKGDKRRALDDFTEAFARRPDITELRAQISLLGGTVPAKRLSPDTEVNPLQEDSLYREAHDAEQQAQNTFELIVRAAPDSYRAHQIMADSFSAQSRFDDALLEYRVVLRLNGDLPGIHEAIGNTLLRLSKPAEALEEFKAELAIQSRSAGAYTNVGQVMLMMGNDEGAATMLGKALRMDRPPPEVYRLLGKLNLHRTNYADAVTDLNHYVTLRPEDSTGYYMLFKAFRALGDKPRAEQALSLFQKTSRDAKERSRAQAQLEATDRQKSGADDSLDVDQSSVH